MIVTKVLEVNLTHHCNNRCVSCNHGSAFVGAFGAYTMPPDVLRRDLALLKPMLRTDFLCLQGGEPLLHPNLLEMMDIVSQSGVSENVGILTNGRLFPKMPEEFWAKCRDLNFEVRCSVYPNLPQSTLDYASVKATQYGVNYRPGAIGSFFKMLGDFPNGESFRGCPWAQCHTIHDGFFYICPISTFWPKQFMGLPATIDGLRIDENTKEGELFQFIIRKTPLNSCRKCTGGNRNVGVTAIEWHECSSEDEWLRDSTL